MIAPHGCLDFSPTMDETRGFVSATDVAISSPPAYLMSATLDSPSVPPSATATAIPLPPAAWTGFASLAGLGTLALLRHLRRAERGMIGKMEHGGKIICTRGIILRRFH